MKILSNRNMKGRPAFGRAAGMSVLDVLIALSVGAIVLAIGVPTYSGTANRNHVDTTASELFASLNTARSEAVKRRRGVQVCPSADSSSCSGDTGDWSKGWLIFEDANGNNAPDAAEIIRLVNSDEVRVEIEVSDSMDEFVLFQPTGTAVGDDGVGGMFMICHKNSSVRPKIVRVSPAGGVQLDDGTTADCAEES